MRISDWSSDVCSSDLRLIGAATPHAARIVTFGLDRGADVQAIETMRTATGGTFVTARLGAEELSYTLAQPGAHWVSNSLAVLAAVQAAGGDPIGRASCQERVGQSVLITVAAGLLQKTKT